MREGPVPQEVQDLDDGLRLEGDARVTEWQRQRIAGAGGHLSNRVAAELLADLVHADLAVVVLAHLSERCNTEAHARDAVAPALAAAGFAGALHVARQGEPTGPFTLSISATVELPLG